eukprot:1343639-Pleurochrysis_carterae.AAC.8
MGAARASPSLIGTMCTITHASHLLAADGVIKERSGKRDIGEKLGAPGLGELVCVCGTGCGVSRLLSMSVRQHASFT